RDDRTWVDVAGEEAPELGRLGAAGWLDGAAEMLADGEGRVAGLSPATGLWAAVPALVIYAAMGSSRSLSLGPEATTALMTAIAVGPLAAGNPARYAGLSATLALLAGAMVTGTDSPVISRAS